MPNTSVHFPGTVLNELDELAAETGTSRNRLIVEACRKALERRRDWPEGFFAADRYSANELRALQSGWAELDQGITTARQSREMPPF